jgi:hypothetical protein
VSNAEAPKSDIDTSAPTRSLASTKTTTRLSETKERCGVRGKERVTLAQVSARSRQRATQCRHVLSVLKTHLSSEMCAGSSKVRYLAFQIREHA